MSVKDKASKDPRHINEVREPVKKDRRVSVVHDAPGSDKTRGVA